MSLALNKPKLDNLADEIWKSAERLRGKFKPYEYQNVVLPMIVIRRLECVLIKWREEKAAEVLAKRPKLTEKELAKLVKGLETSTAPFSNKTDWTLRRVYEEDHTLLDENFRAYINGFSKNVDDIIEHFNYRATIGLMVKNNRLAPILNQYKEMDLGPDKLSPLEMGYVYEELLRRFSEQSGEEAGEHFTPREVIRLMVELLEIPIPDRHLSIYDPACGTGGMLSVAKEHLLDCAATPCVRWSETTSDSCGPGERQVRLEGFCKQRRSFWLLVCSGLLLIGCGEESTVEPKAHILDGEWAYSFAATSPVVCPAVPVLVGCSGGGVLLFTGSGTSLQCAYSLRGACQDCGFVGDYGSSGNVENLGVSKGEVRFQIANCQFTAQLPMSAEDQIAGVVSCTMGLDPEPSGSWRMIRKD
ncbi:MAG: N-6 DNA methylase [Candidatus Krumholzibacteria bacterium]|nr:N-6 DNA methylase [Candidatus Krumholzibacteria bacterium]MDH4338477.1 N-6 DNA methylase [Candidatus Krumholzibacteria bacterium]MDH5270995.1 N-6 DNA methylase [Candidatus Krumholzibacteria bacterium]